MTKFHFVFGIVFLTFFQNCTKNNINNTATPAFEGNWLLKNVFLGDAIDMPCNANKDAIITFNISLKKDKKNYYFSGKSAVNQYFGSAELISFDSNTNKGTLKMGTIGSTKMAGAPEAMDCETRYFSILGNAVAFEIIDNKLRIGRLTSTSPRDGGTYLIFSKKL